MRSRNVSNPLYVGIETVGVSQFCRHVARYIEKLKTTRNRIVLNDPLTREPVAVVLPVAEYEMLDRLEKPKRRRRSPG